MAVDYDVNDAAPASKAEVMSNHRAVRTNAWSPAAFDFDQKDASSLTDRRYIRSGAYPASTDPKTYDVGHFYIATSGFSAASVVCGELYVEYTIELITPQLGAAAVITNSLTTVQAGGTISDVAIFGTAPVVTGGLVTAATNTLTFLAVGEYDVVIRVTGTTVNDCVLRTAIQGGTAYKLCLSDKYDATLVPTTFWNSNILVTETRIHMHVNVTAVNQTVVFDFSGAGTVTDCKCSIQQAALLLFI